MPINTSTKDSSAKIGGFLMKARHEDRVCDTVLYFIAKRKNLNIDTIYYPDKDKKNNAPSVDRLIKCDGIEIVLEHTLIESYPEQIADRKRVAKLLSPLRTELAGQLPTTGHYQLSIDVGAVKGAKNTGAIQKRLVAWIKSKAPLLQLPTPYKPFDKHYVSEKPHGVPFEVTLYRFPRRDGEFWIGLNAPDDLQEKRRQRIRKALEEKCPKLYRARVDTRNSILLLECADIFLGNDLEIAEVVTEEVSLRNDAPDEIYLIDTWMKQWAVSVLKEGENLFPDIENAGPCYLDPMTK